MGKHPCCLSRTSGTNHPAAQVPHTSTLQFSNCRCPDRMPSSITLSSTRYTLVFDHRLTIIFGCAFGYSLLLFAMDKDTDSAKDVPATATSVPSTPTTSAATDVSARRSCPRCARWMSSLQFDKHALCVVCRDVKCSLDTRCKECKSWSKEFMLG